MALQRAMTHRVRRALSMLDMEDHASDVVNALGVRGLVVVERQMLVDEAWLQERIESVRLGDAIHALSPRR